MQQYESQSQARASIGAVAMSQPRAYSIAPAHQGMADVHRQRSLSHLVRDEEPDARNPRGGRVMPDPVGEAWGQDIHPALQRKPAASSSTIGPSRLKHKPSGAAICNARRPGNWARSMASRCTRSNVYAKEVGGKGGLVEAKRMRWEGPLWEKQIWE